MHHAGPTTGSRSPRDFSVFVPLTVVQIAPYFLGVCTIMVGSVCGYAHYFETEEEPLWHAVPFVLQLWLGFLAVNFLLSLVGDHAKHDGSPAFMLIPNVCCQFILIPAIYYYAFTTRTERLGGAGAGQMVCIPQALHAVCVHGKPPVTPPHPPSPKTTRALLRIRSLHCQHFFDVARPLSLWAATTSQPAPTHCLSNSWPAVADILLRASICAGCLGIPCKASRGC